MIQDKNQYLEHINDTEQIITMKKVLDKIEKVLKYHSTETTDFLNPYQRRLSYSFLNRFVDISYHEEGGYDQGERKSIIIYPSYYEKGFIESSVGAIQINGNFKFHTVSHRDYLGSVMGLGIKREKIGDIIVHEDYAQIVLMEDIIDYLIYNLDKVGKERVNIIKIPLDQVHKGKENFKEISTTISSLRLDGLISGSINISRSDSQKYINGDRVKVNWEPINKVSQEVNEGDLISVKGFGRFKLDKVLGRTRKDRIRIIVKILK
ncbi:RNA-binding protein [Dethiothermospora halolimnae]|uniref:YlmH family RNA-binding protein n=1 Tax=Dethiothermospora halolimnae TaxID=3114390 RepID=UPI003CCBC690